jgi:hypothetical protein
MTAPKWRPTGKEHHRGHQRPIRRTRSGFPPGAAPLQPTFTPKMMPTRGVAASAPPSSDPGSTGSRVPPGAARVKRWEKYRQCLQKGSYAMRHHHRPLVGSFFTGCHIAPETRHWLEHHRRMPVWDPKIPHTRPNLADHLWQEEAAASMSRATTPTPSGASRARESFTRAEIDVVRHRDSRPRWS